MFQEIVISLYLFRYALSIPIDNGIEGGPEVECGATSLEINFNTRNTFDGHVYVKGLYDKDECRTGSTGKPIADIVLPFDSCNLARVRSLNPRGIFVRTTVVISFHPQFLTKIDRAYRIECFYMEADKTVSTQIDVSEITTGFQTQNVPMPVCRYEILDGSPAGEPVQFAIIGQQVYHKWTCDSETLDTFCAIVHSCVVDDGLGHSVEVLNEEGCAIDKYLLNNLEYPTDLMAGQEAHVYKYADRSQLLYQCQISITIKEPGSECKRPECNDPQGFGVLKSDQLQDKKVNQLRLLKKRHVKNENILDVETDVNVLDITYQDIALPEGVQSESHNGGAGSHVIQTSLLGKYCVSQLGISLLAILYIAMVAIIFVAISSIANVSQRSSKSFIET